MKNNTCEICKKKFHRCSSCGLDLNDFTSDESLLDRFCSEQCYALAGYAKETKMKNIILKVLVGSRAHGLHHEDSDYDYRAVYVTPTKKILSLGHKYKGSEWIEGDKQDHTAWEIGHFLHLATKCNPTILEVFKAPVIGESNIPLVKMVDLLPQNYDLGIELQNLFSCVWNPNDAFNSFVGYGLNQRKKMLDNHLNRWEKYAIAYLRTLQNLIDLLKTGDFSLEIKEPNFKKELIDIKDGKISVGRVVNFAKGLEEIAKIKLKDCKHEPDKDKVNEFLLNIRKKFW